MQFDNCVRGAFVAGAKWCFVHITGLAALPSERDEMEAEAVKRYGDPVVGDSAPLPVAAPPIELDNHHNALVCPYCNPERRPLCVDPQAHAESAPLAAEEGLIGDLLKWALAEQGEWHERNADRFWQMNRVVNRLEEAAAALRGRGASTKITEEQER